MPAESPASPEPETLPDPVGTMRSREGWRRVGAGTAAELQLSPLLAAMLGTGSTQAGLEQVPGCSHRVRRHTGQPGTGPGVWQGWRKGEMAFADWELPSDDPREGRQHGQKAAGMGQPRRAAATA